MLCFELRKDIESRMIAVMRDAYPFRKNDPPKFRSLMQRACGYARWLHLDDLERKRVRRALSGENLERIEREAGLGRGTLRSFVSGRVENMTLDTLMKLSGVWP